MSESRPALAVRHSPDCRWTLGGDGFPCTCGAWRRELRAAGHPPIEAGRTRTLWARAMRALYRR